MNESFNRFVFSIIITILILIKSNKNKSLSKDGCYAGSIWLIFKKYKNSSFLLIKAFFVGVIVSASSFCHFVMLFTFFFVCSKATKYKEDFKRNFDAEFKKGKFNWNL